MSGDLGRIDTAIEERSTKLKGLGIEQLLTPVRAPRANAVAERMVGTVWRECLDHVVVTN